MNCVTCNCSEVDACVDSESGATCAWVEFEPGRIQLANAAGLCTFCRDDIAASPSREVAIEELRRAYRGADGEHLDAERWAQLFEQDSPLVEVYSDYEATQYLRGRGAGA